tara:strand:- start:1298 stop:2011 length:714 start_codon:yes stop_codon:yes gene_type:complete
MVWGTSNRSIAQQIDATSQAQFKATNNLLTLQENHVEEFFTYHGEQFLGALAQLVEDVVEKVVSEQLVKLRLDTVGTGTELGVTSVAQADYNAVTAANIQLDLQTLLSTAINSEVVYQRKMAKSQYLESQGFSAPTPQAPAPAPVGVSAGMPVNGGVDPSQIQGGSGATQFNQAMYQQQQAFSNNSGYPIPPAGTDTMGNPYWIDPNTGQMTYTPPRSGLGLSQMISKGAAWAAWLA